MYAPTFLLALAKVRLEARLAEAQAERWRRQARMNTPRWPDRLLLAAGDLLIELGSRLKQRRRPWVQEPPGVVNH